MKRDNTQAIINGLSEAARDPRTADLLNRLIAVYEDNKTLREEAESVKKQLRQANTNLKRARSDRDSYKELLNSCQVSFETLQGKYDDLKKQTVTDPQNHADLIKEIAILKRELKSEKENANIIARMSGFENILSDLRGEGKPAQQTTTQHQGQAQGDCKLMRIIPLNK